MVSPVRVLSCPLFHSKVPEANCHPPSTSLVLSVVPGGSSSGEVSGPLEFKISLSFCPFNCIKVVLLYMKFGLIALLTRHKNKTKQ